MTRLGEGLACCGVVWVAEALKDERFDLGGWYLAGGVVAALVEGVIAGGVLDPDWAGAGGDVDAADVLIVDLVDSDG